MWHFFYFHFIVSWKPHETIQQQWIEGQHPWLTWPPNLWPSY
jgi:hypothetical protein